MATMDRVRSTINSLRNSERYSRFTLQTEQDGERRVEVKLTEDDADGDAEAHSGGSPTFRPAPRALSRKNICYMVLTTLLVFIIGYMVGYLCHRKPREVAKCEPNIVYTENKDAADSAAFISHESEMQLNWGDITKLLKQKLTSQAFTKTLSDYDRATRLAGGYEDVSLGNRIFDQFKKLEMEPWTDIHHVQLQTPNTSRPNSVIFGANSFKPQGFLAYSGTGTVQGKLVYGNYGRPEDFEVLLSNKIDLKDSVVIIRSGKISFAQKVANAEEKGAAAVLIYPDKADYAYVSDTELYGHVHLGTGDPYTPGFPSFNHTQFPPTKSSGLPKIPAQTITSSMADVILQAIGGPVPDSSSGFRGGQSSLSYSLGGVEKITVEVNNVPVNKEIHNVFGVIKGFTDPDRYIVLGAQRDAWGNGYAKATVGTAALIELAKAVHEMIENDGFRPRRSIVFASWSAGEYGSVGATEWLEAYMSSLDKSVFTYISLDGIVQGHGSFYASGSPLLYTLLENTIKAVTSPTGAGTVSNMVEKNSLWRPMSIDDPAYPFLAFSGIPSISFHFTSPNKEEYTYYNTLLDNQNHLNYETNQRTSEITAIATELAGQMALRLVHDHLLYLDVTRYKTLITRNVVRVNNRIAALSKSGQLKDVSGTWLSRAKGSFDRAADDIYTDIKNTDLKDPEACRLLNDRIMRIEHTLLSPYVSPNKTPFRHLLLGRGPHTLAAIAEMTDKDELHTQLALATWNLQGCANAMVGDIWDIDNEI